MQIIGRLEIDEERGVIYFHTNEGKTLLRICNLPRPINMNNPDEMLDITHMHGANWKGSIRVN
jgi:hypothetical protein